MADRTGLTLRAQHSAGPFSDPRVVLHLAGNENHPLDAWRADQVGLHQSHDGPAHLVIGRNAPDEALQRAARRLRIDVSALFAFRDAGGPRHG